MSGQQESRTDSEYADLMARAERGQLTPAGFKRVAQLVAEKPERGLPPRRTS